MSETEWGIKHSQGIATCSNEHDAKDRLPEFLSRYEANFRIKTEPQIVCRTVTEWSTPTDASEPPQADTSESEAVR